MATVATMTIGTLATTCAAHYCGKFQVTVTVTWPPPTHRKAWRFDDGAIECPVSDLEREDLVAQNISCGACSQRISVCRGEDPKHGFQTRREKRR
uniref:Putative secreted protein n=1 Tax=Ixodes ricinus TaxID=34613 RepID=A0A6B0UEY9_IXORI